MTGGPPIRAGFPVACPETLAGLVEVVNDAVISRTLVKNSAGTVTLFAFAEGQELSRHSAPFDALVYVIEGTGRITIDDEDHVLTAGRFVIMPAEVPHAVHADQAFKMLLVMLKGS